MLSNIISIIISINISNNSLIKADEIINVTVYMSCQGIVCEDIQNIMKITEKNVKTMELPPLQLKKNILYVAAIC